MDWGESVALCFRGSTRQSQSGERLLGPSVNPLNAPLVVANIGE